MPLYSDLNQYNPIYKSKLVDIPAVYQSIHNILVTRKGERLFNPEFGTDLEETLFELMDNITAEKLFVRLTESIERWEPRVIIQYSESSVIPDYDTNTYYLNLVFTVKGYGLTKYQYEGEFTGVVL